MTCCILSRFKRGCLQGLWVQRMVSPKTWHISGIPGLSLPLWLCFLFNPCLPCSEPGPVIGTCPCRHLFAALVPGPVPGKGIVGCRKPHLCVCLQSDVSGTDGKCSLSPTLCPLLAFAIFWGTSCHILSTCDPGRPPAPSCFSRPVSLKCGSTSSCQKLSLAPLLKDASPTGLIPSHQQHPLSLAWAGVSPPVSLFIHGGVHLASVCAFRPPHLNE